MQFINQIIGYPLGWIMWALYTVMKNYGLSLFVFTLIIKAATFPLTFKQQKSSSKMAVIQPMMAELQSKYKNNKEKYNEELMALYQREGYNPMSGCLPMLISMPILFGMIDVIYNPLKHILRLPADIIQAGVDVVGATGGGFAGANASQLELIRQIKLDPDAFSVMGMEAIQKIQELNLSFFWMDLTQQPSVGMLGQLFTDFNPVVLIPILSGVSALASSIQMMRNTPQTSGSNGMKGMMYMMPVFSTWIAFSVAGGVGLYWFFSNILAIIQSAIIYKFFNPKEMAEKAKQEAAARQEQERLERIEAKKKIKASKQDSKDGQDGEKLDDSAVEKALTAKEINRRKLAEARKRDAERYGEVYVEVTDEDLV